MAFGMSTATYAVSSPAQVTNLKVALKGTTKHRLTWKAVTGATGYVVYCKQAKKDSRFKVIQLLTGKANTSYTVTGRSKSGTYYYKVRAYKTVKGTMYFGKLSSYVKYSKSGTTTPPVVDPKVIQNPTQAQKYMTVFGTKNLNLMFPGGYYTSQSVAQSKMKTITVKTWDFASGKSGPKISRTWNLTVNANLAPTVQQIFKEIYAGSEKFPIHALGGFRWEAGHSEHNTGTAIDINWDENYMVNTATGVITAGSFWRPGKDPYSIPKDGEVARIFKKYGFSQGDWGTSKDYMHFSYFGT